MAIAFDCSSLRVEQQTLHHSSLAADIKKPGGAGGAGGIGGVGSRKSIRLSPGLPRTILSRVGVGK